METNRCQPVLWPLQPISIGTPDAESAESYAWRLADAHGVPWQTLHKFINSQGPEIYKDLRGQPPRLDAPTHQAATYMQRVAGLVGRPEVESLGLSWLAGRVRAQHVFRVNRAWCGACLAEMKAGRAPYAPLIWSLAGVTHCVRHGTRLREHCSACGANSSIRRVGAGAWDRCVACSAALATGGREVDERVRTSIGISAVIKFAAAAGVPIREILRQGRRRGEFTCG